MHDQRLLVGPDPERDGALASDDPVDEEILGRLVLHDGGERRVVEVAIGGAVVVPEVDQRLLETGDAVAARTEPDGRCADGAAAVGAARIDRHGGLDLVLAEITFEVRHRQPRRSPGRPGTGWEWRQTPRRHRRRSSSVTNLTGRS